MERSARQFLILGDEALYQAYLDAREELQRSANMLGWLGAHPRSEEDRLAALRAEEERLFGLLGPPRRGAEAGDELAAGFSRLGTLAGEVLNENRQRIWDDAVAITNAAAELNRRILLLAGISLPVTAGLGVLFVILINRPLRRVDSAIRSLGNRQLTTAIRVEGGPRDFEELGERLEWLRLRLLELEQQKMTFLRHISHELKTPLTAIREGADLLRDQESPLAERLEIAALVRDNSVRLQRLIEHLLEASARPAGPGGEGLPVALDEQIRGVLAEQKLALSARNLTVDTDLAEVRMTGNPAQLRIVVDNLLSNAVKFSPRGGRIGVCLRLAGASAILDVQDAGPGIPASERVRVFEPFVQGQAVPLGPVKGTGLGLSIARDHVEAHGGRIEVLDHAGGALVRVTLPLAASPS